MRDESSHPTWAKVKSDLKKIVVGVTVGLCLIFVVSFLAVYGVSYRGWVAFTNNVAVENVYVEPKPHDCEWDSAPLGSKHCHYESHVVQTAGVGNHIDDSKIKIAVEWEKVTE